MQKSIDSHNTPKTSHIMGIDFGTAKVGLALADSETRIAFADGTLDNNRYLFQKLAEIIAEKDIKQVIIGIPSYVNKKEVEYPGETLGRELKKLMPKISVEYQNEMFTTKMAQVNLIAKGVKGVKKFDDQEAARIILQSWLDRP